MQFCFDVGFATSLLSHLQLDSLLYLGLGRLSAYALLQSSQATDLRLRLLSLLSFSLVHLCFPSLIISALYTMLTDYMSYTLDSTTYQMMLVSRFQMLAWSVFDGTVDRVLFLFSFHPGRRRQRRHAERPLGPHLQAPPVGVRDLSALAARLFQLRLPLSRHSGRSQHVLPRIHRHYREPPLPLRSHPRETVALGGSGLREGRSVPGIVRGGVDLGSGQRAAGGGVRGSVAGSADRDRVFDVSGGAIPVLWTVEAGRKPVHLRRVWRGGERGLERNQQRGYRALRALHEHVDGHARVEQADAAVAADVHLRAIALQSALRVPGLRVLARLLPLVLPLLLDGIGSAGGGEDRAQQAVAVRERLEVGEGVPAARECVYYDGGHVHVRRDVLVLVREGLGRVESAGFLWAVAAGGVVPDSAADSCGKTEGEEGIKKKKGVDALFVEEMLGEWVDGWIDR